MPVDEQEMQHTDDLSKDLQMPGDEYRNMEGENHSLASEGKLKKPEEDIQPTKKQTTEREKTSLAEDESTKPGDAGS